MQAEDAPAEHTPFAYHRSKRHLVAAKEKRVAQYPQSLFYKNPYSEICWSLGVAPILAACRRQDGSHIAARTLLPPSFPCPSTCIIVSIRSIHIAAPPKNQQNLLAWLGPLEGERLKLNLLTAQITAMGEVKLTRRHRLTAVAGVWSAFAG
jgi:hypothetical protein